MIVLGGRPLSSDGADRYMDALLEAWNPAEKGAQAIADVLLGAYNPGGKLPLSVARCAGQAPLYYNHPNGSAWHQGDSIGFKEYVDMPHTPRYCFGYGLSYTNFSYSDLHIWAAGSAAAPGQNSMEGGLSSKEERNQAASTESDRGQEPPMETVCILPDDTVGIRVTVENIGAAAGDEVVQLYVRDCFASMARPVKELAGFRRVHLEPGERKRVTFLMKASQMAFLDEEMCWKTEKGLMEVQLGSSSEDIGLTGTYTVTEDGCTCSPGRGFYAVAEED